MKLTHKIALFYVRQSIRLLAITSPKAAAERAFRIFCRPLKQKKTKASIVFDHAEELTLQVGNNKLRGYRWNKGAAKKVMILHGMHSSSRNFERYVQPLTEKGFEVLAFDAPAHGESEGSQVTVLQYREMIAQVNHFYGPITRFLAHSFGGLAISLALENLPNDADSRVVLIAPATETTTAIDNYFNFLGLNSNIRDIFDGIIVEKGGELPSWYSIKRSIANIRAKVLWFQDTHDEVTPMKDVQPIIDAAYPNIEFIITEHWGHRRIYREQKVVNRSVDFLAS